jgi:hypothetical protein
MREKASFSGFPAIWFSTQAIRPDEHRSFQYIDTALIRPSVYIRTTSPLSAYFAAKIGQDITLNLSTRRHISNESNTPSSFRFLTDFATCLNFGHIFEE